VIHRLFVAVCMLAALAAAPARVLAEDAKPIRVVVWDERQPEQKTAYDGDFLGNTLAKYLGNQPGLTVKSVGLDDPDQGLSKETLDNCDVLIWWGHKRHGDVKPELATDIVERIRAGKLSLLALHSAHWSRPFMAAMNVVAIDQATAKLSDDLRKSVKINTLPAKGGLAKRDEKLTPWSKLEMVDGVTTLTIQLPSCVFPGVRADGKPSHVTTLVTDHPIAKGIPATFDLPQTEMYEDPFHVPAADAVLFLEKWDAGESFHSGQVWTLGKGKVFYFRPGHETYPIYKQEIPLKIVENAVRFLADKSAK
jgi:trehalose utilization protein